MSLKVAQLLVMVPDGHSQLPDPSDDPTQIPEDADLAAEEEDEDEAEAPITPTPSAPSPNGILFKGRAHRKRVTFRDSNLCHIREIPPRSRSGSSTGDEESDEDEDGNDDEDDSGSEDSEDESESDSEDETGRRKAAAVHRKTGLAVSQPQHPPLGRCQTTVTYKEKGVTVTRTTSVATPPASTIHLAGAGVPRMAVRAERAPIPRSSTPVFISPHSPAPPSPAASGNTPKVPFEAASSLTGKVLNPVSAAPASPALLKLRTSSAGSPTSSVPPKKPSVVLGVSSGSGAVVLVERKAKKITPTLEHVMTAQTVRSVHKHAVVSDTLSRKSGGNAAAAGKTKKKRASHHHRHHHKRSGDGAEWKQKWGGASSRSSHKGKDKVKLNGGRPYSPAGAKGGPQNRAATGTEVSLAAARNGFPRVRDSLTLPPLGQDDSARVASSSRASLLTPLSPRTSVYTLDGSGFIFPGDPALDLALGMRTVNLASGAAEEGQKGAFPGTKERISSAPPTSPVRRRRFYAWQMANGNLQGSLSEQPCITPMWDTVQSVTSSGPLNTQQQPLHASWPSATKPAFVAER